MIRLEEAKLVATPAEKVCSLAARGLPPLPSDRSSLYRSVVMRCAYLGQDCVDICESVKSLARFMASPTEHSWGRPKRLGTFPQRLSAGCPRIPRSRSLWHHHLFHRQRPCRLVVYSQEYKWIGLYGRVCLKSSSTTRSTIALSSGESEFYSIVKAASAGLGLRAMYSCPKRCAIRFVWYVFKEGSRQVETQSEGFYGYSVQQQVKNKVTDLRAVSTHRQSERRLPPEAHEGKVQEGRPTTAKHTL